RRYRRLRHLLTAPRRDDRCGLRGAPCPRRRHPAGCAVDHGARRDLAGRSRLPAGSARTARAALAASGRHRRHVPRATAAHRPEGRPVNLPEAPRINPSILAADFVNMQSELARIASADFAHVDVMDNHFVPNLTFGPQMVQRIQETSPIPLDVHLMIDDPDRWAPGYAELGAASVTFHLDRQSVV